jgi:hypothetical protein
VVLLVLAAVGLQEVVLVAVAVVLLVGLVVQ